MRDRQIDMLLLVLVAAVVSLVTAKPTVDDSVNDRVERSQTATKLLQNARDILKRFDAEYTKFVNEHRLAQWNHEMNLMDEKRNVFSTRADYLEIVAEANAFPWRDIEDEYVKRQFKRLIMLTARAYISESLPDGYSFAEPKSTIEQMEKIYSSAKICDYKNETKCDLALEPEITEILMRSRDPEELKHIWVEWRKASGEQVKSLYPKYVEYANIDARFRNFSDKTALWLRDYEADDFLEQIETVWQQLKPLYLQLHAYVRRELRKKYGEDVVSKDGPIPAHLLGNMWADSWSNIADFTVPYPGKQMPDVTAALFEQGYNATGIFRLAEDFFKSINLSAMPDTFWEKSILEKPKGVEMSCQATAWDFYDGKDFRISQCTRVNMENLLIAHHEMGHIEYFMQYKNQPALFKESANPGFHEAVGDVIYLSASTPGHLQKIGLLEKDSNDPETSLNYLYLMSLEKIALLPFAYTIDRWRWNVFQGRVTPDNYNCHWWSLAEKYQGIEPPVNRSEEDFDPAAKFHIIADVEFIKYFVSYVIQFQFHKALCIKARQYDPTNPSANPLHQCDIYGNKDAGNLLKSMMALGLSKPWPDAMEMITGQRQMDAADFLEYFKPIIDWLTEENKKTNEYIGWKPSNKRCVRNNESLQL